MQAHVHFPNGAMALEDEVPLVLGRGMHGINDNHVSREHLRIVLSRSAQSVTAKCVSATNPIYVWKKGKKEPICVRSGASQRLADGDKVSLLVNKFSLLVTIDSGDTVDTPTIPLASPSKRRLAQTPSFESDGNATPPPPKRARKGWSLPTLLSPSEASYL